MKKFYFVLSFCFACLFFSLAFASALGLVVHVPEKYTTVHAGDRFYFEIEIKYPENPQRKDLKLEYEILNEAGDVIAQSKVLKAVETQASFIDFIVIPENAGKGLHVIKVHVADFESLSEEVEASFYVVSGNNEQLKIYFFILLGAILLVGLLILANIFIKRSK